MSSIIEKTSELVSTLATNIFYQAANNANDETGVDKLSYKF